MSLECPSRLGFHRPFNQTVRERLLIRNLNDFPVTFKVKTTAPRRYCVHPNVGKVEASSDLEVQVLLQAMTEEPPSGSKCKDKFLVQSLPLKENMGDQGLHEIWARLDEYRDLLHEKKIRCIYISPEESEELENTSHSRIEEPDGSHFNSFYKNQINTQTEEPVQMQASKKNYQQGLSIPIFWVFVIAIMSLLVGKLI